MGCFPCAGKSLIEKPYRKRRNNSGGGNNRCGDRDNVDDHVQRPPELSKVSRHRLDNSKAMTSSSQSALLDNRADEACGGLSPGMDFGNRAKRFTYAEMIAATQDFKDEYFLGEGGFGKVYKGLLPNTEQIVAIKQLDRDGCQGTKEFSVEVSTLGKADHPNLVKLCGYCDERDQNLLVYEFMPFGSLEDHLHGSLEKRASLDWNTRMKIVAGAAMGLEYLHNKMNPPVIYRDLKCSNILLGEGYHPKLSDFGLAKDGPSGDRTHVSTRVMGTYGYCAPDYAMTGQLNFKSDIYSFGVVLLEIVTGRKAIDYKSTGGEQTLVEWAKPMFKDRKKFHKMVDPALEGQYPVRGLYQALAIAAMCTQEQPSLRPLISDVVNALNFLASQRYDPKIHPVHSPRTPHSPGTPQFPGMNKNTSEE